MQHKIIIITISILSSINIFAQSKYNLLAQKSDKICLYNFTENKFEEILKLKTNNIVVTKQISDTIILFQKTFKNDEEFFIKYLIYLPDNISVFIDTMQLLNKVFLPYVQNKTLSRKDTFISFSKEGKYISFSRIVDNRYIYAKEGKLYITENGKTNLFLKHYSGSSYATRYLMQGFVYPEITCDGKKVFCLDTYQYLYKKNRFLNKFIGGFKISDSSYIIKIDCKTKKIINKIKIPFITTATIFYRKYRNLQLSPDDKYLFFEAYPDSYLYDTETGKIIKLPKGYYYLTWLK